MTSRTGWAARLAMTGLAAGVVGTSTLLAASPAHADRAQECRALIADAQIAFNLYDWYGIALGYDSRQAKAYLGQSQDAAEFWLENC
jgi:hypothetical protein